EVDNQLIFSIRYAGELFDRENIENLLSISKNVLEQVADNPNQEIERLSYLDGNQYKKIIEEWNARERENPANKTIQELFEEQVEKTPESIAVVYKEINLTYRELNERANRLAHYLRENYIIEPDTLIALCLDRSEHMLISILAILKAGGA